MVAAASKDDKLQRNILLVLFFPANANAHLQSLFRQAPPTGSNTVAYWSFIFNLLILCI